MSQLDLNKYFDYTRTKSREELLKSVRDDAVVHYPGAHIIVVASDHDKVQFFRSDGLQPMRHFEVFRKGPLGFNGTYGYNIYVFTEATVFYDWNPAPGDFITTECRVEDKGLYSFIRQDGNLCVNRFFFHPTTFDQYIRSSAYKQWCPALYWHLSRSAAVNAAKRDLLTDHPRAHVIIAHDEGDVRPIQDNYVQIQARDHFEIQSATLTTKTYGYGVWLFWEGTIFFDGSTE
jgi:hypothetical protein